MYRQWEKQAGKSKNKKKVLFVYMIFIAIIILYWSNQMCKSYPIQGTLNRLAYIVSNIIRKGEDHNLVKSSFDRKY
jgi:hypothetical protein